jgi:hypothetical protein
MYEREKSEAGPRYPSVSREGGLPGEAADGMRDVWGFRSPGKTRTLDYLQVRAVNSANVADQTPAKFSWRVS